MEKIALAITLGMAYVATLMNPKLSFLKNDYISLWCKDGWAQDIVDDKDFGAHFWYGEYENEVFADHCNQVFSTLKCVKVGDKLTIVYQGKVREVTCTDIEVMKVDSQGHIRDREGLYMGDSYSPCVVLYTCKGKDRLVTIWKET